jgi:hypothetical protein
MNREPVLWDPRKYLEFRLFWPYSSGIPGQWMAHQIDTVHWFTGLVIQEALLQTEVFIYGKTGVPTMIL